MCIIQKYITVYVLLLNMSHNVSIRLDDKILSDLKELNLNLSETVRKGLLEEINKKRREEMKKNLNMARELLTSEDIDFYIKAVRETRDQR
jgi:post-segregation antitoxin (ccd killing protein)